MKSSIFLPKKINIGFQNRKDTYTGQLAYVIYFDEKGKLRKETSWENWRDNKIDSVIYDNLPLEGFVLNKMAGGDSSGWNHRQTYVRVYDPRGFEFEITIENLLYILANTNSIKGKGLEGQFIYGWDNGDIVLIPINSLDYKEILDYNKQRHSNKKIGVKDLVIGGTYKNKQNEDYVYMGKFDKWDYNYSNNHRKNVNKGKHHFFCKLDKNEWSKQALLNTIMVKSPIDKFIGIVSEDSSANFDDLFERLESSINYSPYDETKDEYVSYTLEEFKAFVNTPHWNSYCYINEENVSIGKEDRTNYAGNYTVKKVESNYIGKKRLPLTFGSLEEIFSQLEFTYKNKYLANGKLYEDGRGN